MSDAAQKEINQLRERMIDVAINAVMARLRELNFPISNTRDFETRLSDLLRFG